MLFKTAFGPFPAENENLRLHFLQLQFKVFVAPKHFFLCISIFQRSCKDHKNDILHLGLKFLSRKITENVFDSVNKNGENVIYLRNIFIFCKRTKISKDLCLIGTKFLRTPRDTFHLFKLRKNPFTRNSQQFTMKWGKWDQRETSYAQGNMGASMPVGGCGGLPLIDPTHSHLMHPTE